MEFLILISIIISSYLILKKLNELIDKQGEISTDLNRVQVALDEIKKQNK